MYSYFILFLLIKNLYKKSDSKNVVLGNNFLLSIYHFFII